MREEGPQDQFEYLNMFRGRQTLYIAKILAHRTIQFLSISLSWTVKAYPVTNLLQNYGYHRHTHTVCTRILLKVFLKTVFGIP